MSHTGYDAYLEGRILSADPIGLVRLLYQGCSDQVREARRRLADGDIAGRSHAISNACEILTELLTSLDRAQGGQVADRLAHLYDYMQRRLVEANCLQEDGPLVETLGLLATLGEAWEGVERQSLPAAPKPPAANPWAPPVGDAEPVSHAWSF